MLNVYLCEDNKQHLAQLRELVENTISFEELDMQLVLAAATPGAVLDKAAASKHSGLYFLDIDLKAEMNGFVLSQKIRQFDPRAFIVFVTTHSEMSYMTFLYKCEAMDFILKDNPEEFNKRIRSCLIDANTKHNSKPLESTGAFTINTRKHKTIIPFQDIIYFETSDTLHKVKLHTTNELIEFSGHLNQIMPLLDQRFIESHRSYILNRDHIRDIDYDMRTARMSNGDICMISTRLMKNFK